MIKKIENYLLLESIGKGNYGEVFKASNELTDTLFAIKVISEQTLA